MVYVGLQQYLLEDINKICKSQFDGVVLGDLFCKKRMFEYQEEELKDFLEQLKKNGKRAIYQSPMYVTDRNFEKILNKIKYFYQEKLIDGVLVQDIGLADAINKKCSGIDVIWSRMGYARTPIINIDTFDWYKEIGVISAECKTKREFEVANQIGIEPYLIYGSPNYHTLNRECYYMYENDIYDGDCKRKCLTCPKMIISGENKIETTIDGYMLGLKYSYSEDIEKLYNSNTKLIIYDKNLEEATKKLTKFKGE